jgi:hypothetical protein
MANLRTNNLFGESGQDSNGSALFDASNHLTAANVAAFRVNQGSSEDFTIEAWIYLRATPDGANARIASIYHTSGNQRSYMFYVHTDDTLKFNYASNGTAGSVSTLAAGRVPHNQWVHVAVTHDSSATTVRLFNNGVLRATDTGAHATYHANTSGDFTIGEDFNGNISNLHITRGTCKYTGDFIPSKEPIEEDSNTTVLCCNSRFNPLSDDKSNTFTQTSDGAVEASSFIPFDRADSGNVFNGPIKHNTQGYMYFPTGRTVERGRGRGLRIANYIATAASNYNTCEFITIQSMGNSIDFGDASAAVRGNSTLASSTRAVSGSGYVAPGNVTTMEFFTIATTGNATNFGSLLGGAGSYTPISNETRGVFAGGYAYPATFNNIDFITIATQGNSQDFGGLTTLRADGNRSAVNSSTRGLIGGGYVSPAGSNNIEFVTIATTGNSQDFGDLTAGRGNLGGLSSDTRGIFFGGTNSPTNLIDFVTIASAGNATDFGDMFTGNNAAMAATSNNTRGVIMGGDLQPSNAFTNIIQHITISTTGDSKDFGDMLTVGAYGNATSDSHGGLS